MKKCETCIYRNQDEYHKPCIVYRADCPLYQKEGEEMTNEEAIEELKAIKSEYGNKAFGDSRLMRSEIEALDVAIKALEQEPCDDAVSRQKVLDLLEDTNNGWVINEVLQLPSANPQQKTGFWCGYDKNDITQWNWWDINTCSICGNGGKHYNKFRYCPNCGAKMESEDKG